MRYEISHIVYCMPWYRVISFQRLTFIAKQFPHILTYYLKSHNTGIKCHYTIRRQHKVGSISCKVAPFFY